MNSNTVGKVLIFAVLFIAYTWFLLDIGAGEGKASADLQCTQIVIEAVQTVTKTKNNLEDSAFNKELLKPVVPATTPTPTPKKGDLHL